MATQAELLQALDVIRPSAEIKMAQLEAKWKGEQKTSTFADPTTLMLIALPILIGAAYVLRLRGKKA